MLTLLTGQTWTATCPHSQSGVLVRGATFDGAEAHGDCEGIFRQRSHFGSKTLTLIEGWSTVEIVCAQFSSSSWTYASSTGNVQLKRHRLRQTLLLWRGLGHSRSNSNDGPQQRCGVSRYCIFRIVYQRDLPAWYGFLLIMPIPN